MINFFQQAFRGNNEWWAYLITLFLLFFGWQFLGVVPLLVVAFAHAGDMNDFIAASGDAFAGIGIPSNLYLLLIIITFFFGLLFLIIGIKFVHKREIKSIVTSREKVDWNRVFYAFFVWGAIAILMIALSYYMSPDDFTWNFKPESFFILLVISLLFLPIQTSFEELLFRGYLMQGFGLWFRKAFVALILSSVIFGLLHGLNPEVEKLGWISMVYYIGTGLVLGIFTLMDDGLELALGFHAANNIVAAVLVTSDWTVFQTDALLMDNSEPSVGWEMFIPVLVLYPLVLYIFSKKYGWNNWRDKLMGDIYKPVVFEEENFIADQT